MTRPVRLRLSRRKGFDLQAHSLALKGLPAVVVARPGPWGNPFVVGKDGTREECVRFYKCLLSGYVCLTCKAPVDEQEIALDHARRRYRQLAGKNLACWCPLDGKPCHADVLLELANAPRRGVANR